MKFIKELSNTAAILIIEHDIDFVEKCTNRIIWKMVEIRKIKLQNLTLI